LKQNQLQIIKYRHDIDVYVVSNNIVHIRYYYMDGKIQPSKAHIEGTIGFSYQEDLLRKDEEYIRPLFPEYFL